LAFCSMFLSHYHAYVITCDPDWIVLTPEDMLSHQALQDPCKYLGGAACESANINSILDSL